VGRGFHVGHTEDVPTSPIAGATGSFRITADHRTGCRNLEQRTVRLGPGRTPARTNEVSEYVCYVVEGRGVVVADDQELDLASGTGLLIPPGVRHVFVNPGPADLVLVSVLSPPPRAGGADGAVGKPTKTKAKTKSRAKAVGGDSVEHHASAAVVLERDQNSLPAGEDRTFKLMIDPRHGCLNVTQFLGFIERSRAPMHTHTYEEVISVLGGEGILHAGEVHAPVREGSTVYLSPGTPHCLENAGSETLRLLGVFSPAGSPADKHAEG
jgi:mannose-6-phosphate isomerase-like protein (cupin superfamily)